MPYDHFLGWQQYIKQDIEDQRKARKKAEQEAKLKNGSGSRKSRRRRRR